jgi:2-polyprenyl-3-methyl-5-hydroxy-6-metoxy-1,4-benzoquinol methylase
MYANPQEFLDCESMEVYEQSIQGKDFAEIEYFQAQGHKLVDNLGALKVLNSLFPNKGSLLEIGSYLGILLDRIRSEGWDVTGLEPFHAVAEYSRNKYGLKVIEELLPEAKFQAGQFDAVMMLHVIEHLPSPAEYLREIRRILKPGGALVVETPRIDSPAFKILGRDRSLSNCNGHVYFFSLKTLRQLLEKNGFEVLREDLVGRTLTADRVLSIAGSLTRSKGVMGACTKVNSLFRLNKARIHVNVRDLQRMYCRAK